MKTRRAWWMGVLWAGMAWVPAQASVICTDAAGIKFRAASDLSFELAGTRCAVERPRDIRNVVYGSSPQATDMVVVSLPYLTPPPPEKPPVTEIEAPSKAAGRPAYSALVERAAKAWGHDPDLLHAVIQIESGYAPDAVSPKGAIGLMQIMPDTARRYGLANAEAALRNPKVNIELGARHLSTLKRTFGGDLRLVLAGYNAGEQAVINHGRRIPPFAETRAYVRDVIDRYVARKACGEQGTCPE